MSSSSRDRKRPAGQVCIGEAFCKLAKYERDRGKWKMLTLNVATYAAIPIQQRAHSAHEELMQNVSGYVCNHGSPSGERDTASPRGRYGERPQRDSV